MSISSSIDEYNIWLEIEYPLNQALQSVEHDRTSSAKQEGLTTESRRFPSLAMSRITHAADTIPPPPTPPFKTGLYSGNLRAYHSVFDACFGYPRRWVLRRSLDSKKLFMEEPML